MPIKKTKEQRQEIVLELYKRFEMQYPQYKHGGPLPPYKCKLPEKFENVNLSLKKMAQIPIKEPVKSVLCGTCIGDSSLRIQPKYVNARIQNRHSTRQAAWFFWKWTVCCSEYINGLSSITYQDADGYQTQRSDQISEIDAIHFLGKLKVSTKAHPDLTALHSIICQKNKEKIERSWLNHMSNYFLMVVWLDDGSLNHPHQGCLCLDNFPEQEQRVFVDYLKSVWDIKAYVKNTGLKMKDGRDRYRIYIQNYESLLNLFRIIAPLVPVKEMLYKVMFVPVNNKGLLQRWASELVELVQPEFRDYVKKYYDTLI